MKEIIMIIFEGFICSFIYTVITGQYITAEEVRFILLWFGIVHILDKLNNIRGIK